MKKQKPGKRWIFKRRKTGEKDVGVLPTQYGESNRFARWQPYSKGWAGGGDSGGSWVSIKFSRKVVIARADGSGPEGLLGRMKAALNSLRGAARRKGYTAPDVTPEQMVVQWLSQKGICAACKGILKTNCKNLRWPHYDHCHETGRGRGFVHRWCNWAEACFRHMSKTERLSFLSWIEDLENNT